MVDLSKAFAIEDGLILNETGLSVASGISNPASGSGTPSAIGSLWLTTTGAVYLKTGPADTNWNVAILPNTSAGQLFIDSNDTTGGYLSSKIELSSNLVSSITNPNNNEKLHIDLSNSGVTPGIYTKLTVDTFGRVTTATNLNSLDVTTALTYTPVNKAGDTMSGDILMNGNSITGLPSTPISNSAATSRTYVDAAPGLATTITGIVSGGLVTLNADPTKINISPAIYYIQGVRYSYGGGIALDPSLGVGNNSVRWGLNATGVMYQAGNFTAAQKQTILPLARLNSVQGSTGPGSVILPPLDQRFLIGEDGYYQRLWQEQAIGVLYYYGGVISESVTPRQVNESAGVLYSAQRNKVAIPGSSNIQALPVYHVGGIWTVGAKTTLVVDNNQYDNGTGLTVLSANNWAAHTLLKSPKNSDEFFLVYSQAQYANQTAALLAPVNYGVFVDQATSGLVAVAQFIIQKGSATISQIVDLRPFIGGKGAGAGGSGGETTLQQAYNLSVNPEIIVDAARGALTIQDNAIPIAANLLEVKTSNGVSTVFGVGASNVAINGTLSSTGVITSTVTTGTAPFTVSSTTPVTNLSIGGNAATATIANNVSGVVAIANGGTGQTTANAAFNALSPMNALGDIIYGGVAGSAAALPGNSTTILKFLSQTGTGSAADTPVWLPLPAQGTAIYYFNDTTSDVVGYKQLLVTPTITKYSKSTSGLVTGATVLQNWITQPNSPDLVYIPAGQYQIHVHAAQITGTKVSQLYCEFWETDSAGVDIVKIGTSEVSAALSDTEFQFTLSYISTTPHNMTSTASRVVCRMYALVSGGGSAPTVLLYYGDGADSHFGLPSTSIDTARYVPYIGASQDVNLSQFNLTASRLISTVATGTSPLEVSSTTPVANLSIGGNAATATIANNVSGVVAITNGGTGLTTLGTANQLLGVNIGASALEYKTVSAGSGIGVTPGAGTIVIANTGVLSVTGTTNQITINGTATNPVVALANNPIVPGIASITIPNGTTAERPSGVAGMHRYNSTLLDNETFNNNEWVPYGKLLQTVRGTIPAGTGTATVTLGNTAPLITDGFQIWPAAGVTTVTPKSIRSVLLIRFQLTLDHTNNGRSIIVSVFDGSTIVASRAITVETASRPISMTFLTSHAPASLTPINYTCRIGANGGGTTYVNRGAAYTLGGALVSNFEIAEILP